MTKEDMLYQLKKFNTNVFGNFLNGLETSEDYIDIGWSAPTRVDAYSVNQLMVNSTLITERYAGVSTPEDKFISNSDQVYRDRMAQISRKLATSVARKTQLTYAVQAKEDLIQEEFGDTSEMLIGYRSEGENPFKQVVATKDGDLLFLIEGLSIYRYYPNEGRLEEEPFGVLGSYVIRFSHSGKIHIGSPTDWRVVETHFGDFEDETSGSHAHPHLGSGGIPCWGTAADILEDAKTYGSMPLALNAVLELLSSYNPNSAYIKYRSGSSEYTCGCGAVMEEDEGIFCSNCSEAACSDCYHGCCECEDYFCSSNCRGGGYCGRCDEPLCDYCSQQLDICVNTPQCVGVLCSGCRGHESIGRCDKCGNTTCEACESVCVETGCTMCHECDYKLCEHCGGRICMECRDGTLIESAYESIYVCQHCRPRLVLDVGDESFFYSYSDVPEEDRRFMESLNEERSAVICPMCNDNSLGDIHVNHATELLCQGYSGNVSWGDIIQKGIDLWGVKWGWCAACAVKEEEEE